MNNTLHASEIRKFFRSIKVANFEVLHDIWCKLFWNIENGRFSKWPTLAYGVQKGPIDPKLEKWHIEWTFLDKSNQFWGIAWPARYIKWNFKKISFSKWPPYAILDFRVKTPKVKFTPYFFSTSSLLSSILAKKSLLSSKSSKYIISDIWSPTNSLYPLILVGQNLTKYLVNVIITDKMTHNSNLQQHIPWKYIPLIILRQKLFWFWSCNGF